MALDASIVQRLVAVLLSGSTARLLISFQFFVTARNFSILNGINSLLDDSFRYISNNFSVCS